MNPWLVFKEWMAVNPLCDLVKINIVVNGLFNYPAFLYCGYVIKALLIDSLWFD